MTPVRAVAALVLTTALAWLGWLVLQTTRADQLASTDPQGALRIDADHPRGLRLRALQQLAAGDDAGATATASHLLRVAPGRGDGFAIIALAASRNARPDARALLEIAARRAPRITQVRAQLAALQLQSGDLPDAMAQIDALLRVDPKQGAKFFPAMVQQSAVPAFADAMAVTLEATPPWRSTFLAALNAKGTPVAVDNIYARLRKHGTLAPEEAERWLDGLMAQGRWGDAFAGWLGTLDPAPAQVPLVRNGGFEQDIDGIGFGWRNAGAPGVFTDIEDGAGIGGGRAAHIQFIGRPAPRGNLRQPLLLTPGRYRLSLKARAEGLHSDRGLSWVVRCEKGPDAGITDAMEGSFDWRGESAWIDIPAEHCSGQWLEMRNPAVAGSAQQVEGDLWIDDIAIRPASAIANGVGR